MAKRYSGAYLLAVVLAMASLLCAHSQATLMHANEAKSRPSSASRAGDTPKQPNFVLFFVDDMGVGDLECYGHPTIRTPHINKLAEEGIRFTQWLSGAAVCSPSRAALMTGRLPVRSGMAGNNWRGGVLNPDVKYGLPLNETIFPQLLHDNGYATMALGKWHLGQREEYLPTNRGFDHYLGVPYSVDMGYSRWNWSPTTENTAQFSTPKPQTMNADSTETSDSHRAEFLHAKQYYDRDLHNVDSGFALPLLANTSILEQPAVLSTLTERYTAAAKDFIRTNANAKDGEDSAQPFFLYMAYNHVHVPLFCNKDVCNTSKRGFYGDNVEEVDKSVGEILDALKESGVDDNTLVVFTSDNGPWLIEGLNGGSAGLFRDGKASTWEGGFREPGIIRWKGNVPENVVSEEVVSTMDIFPTFLRLANISLPETLELDGKDLTDLLLYGAPSPHESYFYYRGQTNFSNPNSQPGLWAIRHGPYKVHYVTDCGACPDPPVFHNPPLIFHVEHDPGEQYELSTTEYTDLLAEVEAVREKHLASVTPIQPVGIAKDFEYAVCCDRNSKEKYPTFPICTCEPENYFK